MKRILIAASLGTLLCAGCSNSNNDSAKIDALNNRLDSIAQTQSVIFSNQAALSARMDAQFDALPHLQEVNDLSRFYYSNSVVKLDKIDSEILLSARLSGTVANRDAVALTNTWNDVESIQDAVRDMQRDIIFIKTRVGP